MKAGLEGPYTALMSPAQGAPDSKWDKIRAGHQDRVISNWPLRP